MPDILLTHGYFLFEDEKEQQIMKPYAPLGLLYLSAYLKREGFEPFDLSDNEVAKSHVRHMVGGHSHLAQHELLYRFQFPERPGALMTFLTALDPNWNISLFHYRNHGADYGGILVGIQVPRGDETAFDEFLRTLAYPCVEETRNPVYGLFLR